ncbi:MAG: InlB B-repeat-containing protein [Clostridia bacterium]|nr:InlB B-repeat-containing protein [Clostridia bacterium]
MVKTKLSFTKKVLLALLSLLFVFAASAALILPAANTAYAASEKVAEFHFWQIGKGSGTRTDNGVGFQYSGIKANTDSNITIGANSTVTITVSESTINSKGITSGEFYIYASNISYAWKRGSTTLKSGNISSFVQVKETSIAGSGDLVLSLTNSNSSDVTGVHFESPNYVLYAAEKRSVSITAGTGVKSVYMSTSSTATSGDSSGTEYADGTTVYGFAKLDKGYSAKSGWTLVSGTANTENAIYRVGSKKISSSQKSFGTISADATSYTISYTLNGGTLPSGYPTNYTITTDTFSLSNPTKTGYAFAGWTGSNGSTKQTSVSITKGSTGNKSYTANWTANTYTVTLSKNNGTGGSDSVTATYGAAMPSATMPTRTGYTFSGYFDSNNVKYYNANGSSAKNWDKASAATLTAKWQINQYPVSCPTNTDHASFFVSSSDNATSGSTSGNFDYNSTVYFYVVADEGYYKPDGSSWQKTGMSGDRIIYRANSLTVSAGTNEFEAETPQMGADIVASATGYKAPFDKGSHSITVNVTTPASGYVVKYKVGNGDYSTTNPQYTGVCNVAVEYKVTADGYYPFIGGATVVITQQENVSYTTAPAKNEGLIYNGAAQALLTAGTSNYGTIQYKLGDEGEWTNSVPQVQNVGEYVVYYRVPADANQAGIPESSFTVSIAEVNKDELNAIINEASDYYDSIADTYPTIAAGFLSDIADAEDIRDNVNVTEEQVADATSALTDKLSTTIIAVAEAKIDAIGTPEDTEAFRGKAEGARELYDALTTEQKGIFPEDVLKVLTDDEAVIDVMDEIDAIGEPEDTADFREKVEDARNSYDALTEDQKEIFPEDVLKTLTDYEAVIDVMDEIDAIGTPEDTEDFREKVEDARNSYDALTDDQKAIFPEDVLKVLTDDEAVIDVMDEIDAIGEPEDTAEFREKVEDARNSYDALTDDQKAIFPEDVLKTLTDDEAIIDVMDEIHAIGKPKDTQAFKDAVRGARESYEELTEDQKEIFPEDALKMLTDYEAVLDVMTEINVIGTPEDTAAFRKKVGNARNAYNALSGKQKAMFPSDVLKILTDDEAVIAVMDEIDAIGDVKYTDTCKGRIDRARNAYEGLTDKQKNLLPEKTLQTLIDAEKAYEAMDRINDIGTVENTAESKAKIQKARESFDNLTHNQKGLVAPKFVKALTDAEAAFSVIDKINDIGDVEYTAESKSLIDDARAAYESLDGDRKAIIPESTLQTLIDAEKAYKAMDRINAIGDVKYTSESKALIDNARDVYDALSEKQKASVKNYGVLTQAEIDYAKVEETVIKINAIGNVEYTAKSKALIDDARATYNALSEKQKTLVSNYSVLTATEEQYAILDKNSKIITVSIIAACVIGVAGIIALLLFFIKKKKKKTEEQG